MPAVLSHKKGGCMPSRFHSLTHWFSFIGMTVAAVMIWFMECDFDWRMIVGVGALLLLAGALCHSLEEKFEEHTPGFYCWLLFGFGYFLSMTLIFAFGTAFAEYGVWRWAWYTGSLVFLAGIFGSREMLLGFRDLCLAVPPLLDEKYVVEEPEVTEQPAVPTPEAEAIFVNQTEFSRDLVRRMIRSNPDMAREELTALWDEQAREVRSLPAPQL